MLLTVRIVQYLRFLQQSSGVSTHAVLKHIKHEQRSISETSCHETRLHSFPALHSFPVSILYNLDVTYHETGAR